MRALLDDPAFVHHHDPVGRAHGRQAVGDDQGRAVPHQSFERLLDEPLAFGIECAGRFVEQQDRCVAQQRAGDRDAPILLLDEATSALDAESERLVQQALERLMDGRTTLVIAHRLAPVRKADRSVVMDGGRIVEEGTHARLNAAKGLYARLAALQFDDTAAA